MYKISISDKKSDYSEDKVIEHINILYKKLWFLKYKIFAIVVLEKDKRVLIRGEKVFKTKYDLISYLKGI